MISDQIFKSKIFLASLLRGFREGKFENRSGFQNK